MTRITSLRKPLRDRFFEKVDVQSPNECWMWTGSKSKKGYGRIGLGRRESGNAMAHRVSYELHVGPIPDGMVVLHKCDNPSCVNPDHLRVGTQVENLLDMRSKGRHRWGERPSGERHPMSKLTVEQVADIRSKRNHGQTLSSLAKEFGVVVGTIHFIVSGGTWK